MSRSNATKVRLVWRCSVPMAGWSLRGQADHEGHRIELSRSHDGEVALVVVDEVITAVHLPDGHVAARVRAGRGIEASFPLDGRWTLDIAGELTADGGHTGDQGGVLGPYWDEPAPDPAGAGS